MFNIKKQETTQGGSWSCVAGLVIVGIGLFGLGLATGMFFPWTGKSKITVNHIFTDISLKFLHHICEAGGAQGRIHDQDDTSLTPIPVGTPSKSQQCAKWYLKSQRSKDLPLTRALDLFNWGHNRAPGQQYGVVWTTGRKAQQSFGLQTQAHNRSWIYSTPLHVRYKRNEFQYFVFCRYSFPCESSEIPPELCGFSVTHWGFYGFLGIIKLKILIGGANYTPSAQLTRANCYRKVRK